MLEKRVMSEFCMMFEVFIYLFIETEVLFVLFFLGSVAFFVCWLLSFISESVSANSNISLYIIQAIP